ncbi:hypothetical protein HOD02_02010 [bacterium]|nr:hypothetical protein [bacterium]
MERLTDKISEIKAKLETQQKALRELEKGQIDAIDKELKKTYFKDIPSFEGADGYSDYSNISFKAKRPDDSYLREICNITIRKSHYQLKSCDQLGISYYSTSDISDFEINRLITIGKVAQVVKDYGSDILETIKEISQPYINTISPLRKSMWSAESEISSLKKEINDILKFKATFKLFKEGYEIPMDGKSGLENVYVRSDYRVSQIKKVRFRDWTNDNRKSLTVELTCKVMDYDTEKRTYVDGEDRVEVHSKVRVSNVSHIINKVREELREELITEELELNN